MPNKKGANTPKTGSKSPRNYDPKNVPADRGTSKGGGVKVSKMYSPAGNDTPSGPGRK